MARTKMPIWVAAATLAAMLAGSAAMAQNGQSPEARPQEATAVFAGGCFWCMEQAFDEVDGVTETISGYTGGKTKKPTYEEVSAGGTGHREAVRVRYDPAKVSYAQLLDVFWRNIDPVDGGGQFCDRGESYLSAIFVADEAQKQAALQSKEKVAAKLNKKVETKIEPLEVFYPAEDYHQDYHNTNPLKYKFYKWNCGRAQRLQQIWGPPTAYKR